MKPADAIESFSLAGTDYWCRRNAKGALIHAESTGQFKGAGSRVISAGQYQKARRNPAASVPKKAPGPVAAFAVSVGGQHIGVTRTATLDIDLIEEQ